jgi:multiple sugar transport system substrate-binding protein
LVLLAALGLLASACTGGDDNESATTGETASGPVTLTFWHGYTDYEADWLNAALDTWNTEHPDIQIEPLFVNNDKALQKLTVALQGGEPPDITYQYGSSLPQVAPAPGLVDLTAWTQQPDVNWEDFIPGARDAATFEGKVLGVPALIDNLAIVYNKTLFDEAGLEYPNADWTWDDFRAAAKALTDPAEKQFGFSYPMDASEDSVWHYDPLLWQNGGSILTEDNTQAAFNSPEGVEALQVLTWMAVDDKSVFLDLQNSPYTGLFNSGKIAMLDDRPVGPGELPRRRLRRRDPAGFDGDHQTIAGPDMWTVFDNGGGREQARAEFLQWLTPSRSRRRTGDGHLPIRPSVAQDQPSSGLRARRSGVDVFARTWRTSSRLGPCSPPIRRSPRRWGRDRVGDAGREGSQARSTRRRAGERRAGAADRLRVGPGDAARRRTSGRRGSVSAVPGLRSTRPAGRSSCRR